MKAIQTHLKNARQTHLNHTSNAPQTHLGRRGGPKQKYKDLKENKEPLFSFRSLYLFLGSPWLFLLGLYMFV